MPDTTDPRYAEFEANLPKYKQELEERYPPVCANCENAVSKRIRAAGTFAKADYLRRVMEKTRTIGLTNNTWTSVSILRATGGLLWFFAAGILVLWNGFGALADLQTNQNDLIDGQRELNVFQCMGEAGALGHIHSACAIGVYHYAGWGVAASLASSWWNPIMRRRIIDRTTGLKEFYKLQAILVVARCGTWYLLGKGDQRGLDAALIRMIHATMLAMNIGVSLLAYCTPRIAKTPLINFHDDHEPLVTGKEAQTKHVPTSLPLSTDTQVITTSASVSFPFNKANTSPIKERYHQEIIDTDEDLDLNDAMDIDSPQPKHNFRPVSSRTPKTVSQEPSPFYGKLPPAPVSQEHRLRNPPNKPSFQKTSSERQDKFFQSMVQPRSDTGNGKLDSSTEFRLQEPKLVIKQDKQETGLENWFSSNVFSLGDSKIIPLQDQATSNDQDTAKLELTPGLHSLFPIVLLLTAIAFWTAAPMFSPWSSYLYQCATFLGAAITTGRFITVVSNQVVNGSDVLLCVAELFGAVILAYQTRQAILVQLDIDEALGAFPTVYFAFMVIQECIIIVTAYRRGNENSATHNSIPKHQTSSPSLVKSSQPREKKLLPLKESTALYQSQPNISMDQRINSMDKKSKNRVNGSIEHLTKSTALGTLNLDSYSSLSGNNILAPTSKRTSRTLQARSPKPWEVGGI